MLIAVEIDVYGFNAFELLCLKMHFVTFWGRVSLYCGAGRGGSLKTK